MTSAEIKKWQEYTLQHSPSGGVKKPEYMSIPVQSVLATLEVALQQAKFNELLESKQVILTLTPAMGRMFKEES